MKTQEEFKTSLGQLLTDLKMNWAYDYYDRLCEAKWLCHQIKDDTSHLESTIEGEIDEPYDGRIFRNESFYGYSSNEGNTESVKGYLKIHLSCPEYCELLEN